MLIYNTNICFYEPDIAMVWHHPHLYNTSTLVTAPETHSSGIVCVGEK